MLFRLLVLLTCCMTHLPRRSSLFPYTTLFRSVHMAWRNPKVAQQQSPEKLKRYGGRIPDSIRIGTVQYMQRRVSSFEEFMELVRSEEHTSELQSRENLVCRLLLEKKKHT